MVRDCLRGCWCWLCLSPSAGKEKGRLSLREKRPLAHQPMWGLYMREAGSPAVGDAGSTSQMPGRQAVKADSDALDLAYQLLNVHVHLLSVADPCRTSTAGVVGDGVDERRTLPTVGCRTRKTERGEEDAARPRAIRRGIDSGGTATRGAAVLRPHRRPAHGRKTQLAQGCLASEFGEAARREAASPRSDRRPAHDEGARWPSDSHAAGMRSRSGRLSCLQESGALRPTC